MLQLHLQIFFFYVLRPSCVFTRGALNSKQSVPLVPPCAQVAQEGNRCLVSVDRATRQTSAYGRPDLWGKSTRVASPAEIQLWTGSQTSNISIPSPMSSPPGNNNCVFVFTLMVLFKLSAASDNCCIKFIKLLSSFLVCDTCFIMVVVAFSSRARIFGECSTIHSPACAFFFFLSGD